MQIKNTVDAIMNRRSYRKYKSDQLTAEEYKVIMDAFDWAPTARNKQEIRAFVMRDAKMLNDLRTDFEAFCDEDKRVRFKDFYYGAPMLVILAGPKDFPYTVVDSGIAVENMAVAAEGIGVGSVILGCITEYFRSDASKAWRDRLGFTDNEMFTIACAFGYPGSEMPKPKRKTGKIVEVK